MQNEQAIRAEVLANQAALAPGSDETIAAQGSAEGFIQLYQTHIRAVYCYALARLKNPQDAEDVTADVFKRAWKSLPRYRPDGAFKSWLFGIAHRAVADHYRKHGRPTIALDVVTEVIDPAVQPEEGALTTEQVREVFGVLADLGEEQQEIITLRFFSDLPYEEIARIMNKRVSAVKMMAYRALEAIRRRIPDVKE
jgi:RNA polymerase sigma-70 factor (ECF subfamily)